MKKVSRKTAKELAALARMPDDKIDLTDSPEVREWRGAVMEKFYRPIKRPVTIRVDADVLARLKRKGRGCYVKQWKGSGDGHRPRKIFSEKSKPLTAREEYPTFAKPKPQR